MQIGMSTASLFGRYDVEDALLRMEVFGVRLCEVFLNTYLEYEEEFVSLLKQRIETARLQIYSVHPMGTQFEPQLFSLHARQRADAWKIFESVLCAAKSLGARYYVMHGPASMGGMVKNMEFSRIGPITQELCAMAAQYGVTIAWENVSWGLYNTPGFGPELMRATRGDDLRFTLDIKQAARSGYSPFDFLNAMEGALVNVHVCDYTQGVDRVRPALPCKGECDWARLRKELEAIGYSGPVMYEVYSDLYKTENEMLQSLNEVRKYLGDR